MTYNNGCTSVVSSSVCFHILQDFQSIRKLYHNIYILVYALACVIHDFYVKRLYYNYCTDMASPLCVSSCGIQECHSMRNPCYNGYIAIFFHFDLLYYVIMSTPIWYFSLCIVKTCLFGVKVLSHLLHWYGISLLCVDRWIVILLFCWKALSH